jgi:threonine dehydrogenase-like Zn-dependent dehydrogenase
MGAAEVAVEARHPHQVDACERIGAVTTSGTYDVVLETAGTESSLHRAVELARPGGTVVYIGAFRDIRWPEAESFTKEVGILPSLGYSAHNGRREFAEAAEMLASRPELAQILITHRFPIEDAPEAFRVAADKSRGVFRVVVEP